MTSTDHETEVLARPDGGPALTEALAAVAPRRWWNHTTVALLGLTLLIGGFLAGVQAQSRWGTSATTAAPGSGTSLGGFPSGGMPSGAPGRGTTGTVTLVDGTTLYLQTESGETMTVRTGATTTIRQSQIVTLDKLLAGVPVTVQGVPDSAGVLTATSVTAG